MPYSFKSILLSILITLVAYGTFPLIFAKIRKKAITTRAYLFTCFAFNFFIRLFFFIFNNSSASAPYVIWTIVFSSLGKHILNSKYILVANRNHICPNCKSPLQPNRNNLLWCSSCGYVSQTIKQPNEIKSAGRHNAATEWKCSCGRVHPKNVFSCVCGKNKTDFINLPKSGETSDPATKIPPATTDKICFCRKCGEKLVNGSNFCGKCGTEVIKE